MPEWQLAQPVDFEMGGDEHIAIVGPNAAGKSMLVDVITSAHPLIGQQVTYDFNAADEGVREGRSQLVSDNIRYITFRDTSPVLGGSMGVGDDCSKYYLQQRWNLTEEDEADAPLVGRLLDDTYRRTGADNGNLRALRDHLYDLFGLHPLLTKPLLCLSSGELRKFVLCRALMADPRVLIIDNPFIGLDRATRQQVREALETLTAEHRLQLILVLANEEEIPPFITHVVPVRDRVVLPKMTREAFVDSRVASAPSASRQSVWTQRICEEIRRLPHRADCRADEVVQLHHVSIRYGDRTILKDLDWTVQSGERWALSGQNGAGKSTLLSLVCADNPQSYACDIRLFGRKRGSGESIWDIKRHIGYVSPEMHRAYNRNLPALRIVASGLKDTVGLYVPPSSDEYDVCRMWMRFLGIDHLADRSFLRLSSGEQRMVLLARSFVKDPSLLILDEPFHGLDRERSEHVKAVIEAFCARPDKTLIMVTHYEEELPPCITHHLHLIRNI